MLNLLSKQFMFSLLPNHTIQIHRNNLTNPMVLNLFIRQLVEERYDLLFCYLAYLVILSY